MGRTRASLALAAVVLMLASCKKQPTARPKLDVELIGCSVIERGAERICELEPGARLHVVASVPELRARVDVPGAAWLTARRETLGQRSAIEIEVPAGAQGLYVEGSRSDPPAAARIALQVVTRPWLTEARAKRDRGDYAGAWAAMRNAEDNAVDSALVTSLMARIDLARGDIRAAHDMFVRAIASHRALGRISDAVDDSFALSFALVQRSHGYAEARKVLDDVAPLAERTPEGRARLPYYRASLAAELGDRRAALDLASRAEAAARDVGLGKLVRNARNLRATQLQALGRYLDADAILDDLERTTDPNTSRCEPAELAINSGYGALRRAEVATADRATRSALLKRAEDALSRAVTAARHERCGDPHLLGTALGDLAWTLYRAGDHARARDTLQEARRHVPDPRGTEALSWLELSGLLALDDPAQDEAARLRAARAAFERELREAQLLHLRESEWGALTGLATALLRAKDGALAAKKLDEAERVLDEIATFVPLGAGRGSFLRDRSESARLLVALHLDAKRPEAALDAARRARVRMLASVRAALRAERLDPSERVRWEDAVERYRAVRDEAENARASDWKLPADQVQALVREREAREARVKRAVDEALAVLGVSRERTLPPLARDAVSLFVHSTTDATWFFITTPRADRVEVVATRSDEDVAASLAKVLERSVLLDAKLRVLAGLPGRDLGALPLREGLAGERFAIEDSLDLGETGHRVAATSTRTALVVADPLGDLPAARREGDDVTRMLRAGGAVSVSLVRGSDAHATKIRAELPGSWLFHYAGHAVWAGHEGWDSHLRLANGTSFELADVLTLPRVPARVVLSSCESGAAIDSAGTTSFGLAQAFVVAGSEAVLAPSRPVGDASVAAFAAAVAVELNKADVDPAQAVRRASAGTMMKAEDRWAFHLVRP